jgi:hypothetical protein
MCDYSLHNVESRPAKVGQANNPPVLLGHSGLLRSGG